MANRTRFRDRKFASGTHKSKAIFVAATAGGVAAVLAVAGQVTGGWNMWGVDESCTNDDLWRQVGLKPPCGDGLEGRHEYDPGRATVDTVHGPDGTPDWFTATDLTVTVAVLLTMALAYTAFRRRGERVVAS